MKKKAPDLLTRFIKHSQVHTVEALREYAAIFHYSSKQTEAAVERLQSILDYPPSELDDLWLEN